MLKRYIPVTIFRSKVLEAVRNVKKLGTEYIITAKGEPAAVLIGFDEWENLLETLDIRRDPTLMRQIAKNRAYFRRGGKGKDHRELPWD